MKPKPWRIGLAVFLIAAGLFFAVLGFRSVAMATSISNLQAGSTLRMDTPYGRLNGIGGNFVEPESISKSAKSYVESMTGVRIQTMRGGIAGRLNFGAEDLIGFMINSDHYTSSGINIRFNLDRRQTLDWMQFWTDFSLLPETEHWLDFQAIALASYAPEIRYWLIGTRWASFDTTLPHFGPTISDNLAPAGPSSKGGGQRGNGGEINFGGGNDAFASGSKKALDPAKAKTLQEFLLSLGSKIIRQPIVYVILLVGVIVFFVGTRRQSGA